MLKTISPIITPLLLKTLCEMGHGDKIVFADANFPAESMGKNAVVIRCDGHGITRLLQAVLPLLPLDSYVEKPATLMAVAPGDKVETPVWEDYKNILRQHEPTMADPVGHMERFAFYEAAKTAYAIVATGEKALYANIMLQKGVI